MRRHLQKHSYDIKVHNWKKIFQKLYGIEELSDMHKYLPASSQGIFEQDNDSSTLMHKIFYSNFEDSVKSHYIRFLKEVRKTVGFSFYYQQIPCIRIGLPNMRWLTEYHTDNMYNHPEEELNINLAITKSGGSAALHIEDKPGSQQYKRITQDYGEYTFIDHIGCRHGSEVNLEGYTLISLDFRIIPEDVAKKAFKGTSSVLQNKKFSKGDYFSSDLI